RALHSFPTRRSSDLWAGVTGPYGLSSFFEAGAGTAGRAISRAAAHTARTRDMAVLRRPDRFSLVEPLYSTSHHAPDTPPLPDARSEEHTSELQSLAY